MLNAMTQPIHDQSNSTTDKKAIIIHNLKMIENYSRKTAELIEEEQGEKTDISNQLESGARTAQGWIEQLEKI